MSIPRIGLAIAAAALSGDKVAAVMPDVPFLCDFPNAIVRTPSAPFTEITRFLAIHRDAAASVLRTLSYVDGAILARRIQAPALFALMLRRATRSAWSSLTSSISVPQSRPSLNGLSFALKKTPSLPLARSASSERRIRCT